MEEKRTVQEVKENPSNLAVVKQTLAKDTTKEKFAEVLGDKAPQFLATIANVTASSNQLRECEPASILSAAYVAATFDLPVDGNLGFSALVPYNKRELVNGRWESKKYAQFQIMYKGFIQLAIRTGSYETMNCTEVYEDEIKSYNPILDDVEFVEDFSRCSQRINGELEKIIGYYAYFKMQNGYKKSMFWTTDKVRKHAIKYSDAYNYDLKKGKKSSRWSTDFVAMGKKTVIKMLLSKWGELTMEIKRAIEEDQKVYDADGNGSYLDNERKPIEVAIDPFALEAEGDNEDEVEE